MFSYSTGYYVSPSDDQYLKFKNRCNILYTYIPMIGPQCNTAKQADRSWDI